MAHCTQCGEAVPTGSKFCPGCGSAIAGAAQAPQATRFKPRHLVFLLSALLLIYVLLQCARPDTVKETPAEAHAADERGRACKDALDKLQAAGLIREREPPNRVDVDDLAWAALPAKEKRALSDMVRCAMLNGRVSGGGYAVVYGERSGKRLAMATSDGTSLE